jgi:hypothetical protein
MVEEGDLEAARRKRLAQIDREVAEWMRKAEDLSRGLKHSELIKDDDESLRKRRESILAEIAAKTEKHLQEKPAPVKPGRVMLTPQQIAERRKKPV